MLHDYKEKWMARTNFRRHVPRCEYRGVCHSLQLQMASQSQRTSTTSSSTTTDPESEYAMANDEINLNRGSYALLVGHEVDDDEWRLVCAYGSGIGTERQNRYYLHQFTDEEIESGEIEKWHLPESKMFTGPELHAYMAANKRFLTNILWRELVRMEQKRADDPESWRLSYEQQVDLVRVAMSQAPEQREIWGVVLYSYYVKPNNQ